jgi:hypothetical protein
LGHDPTKLEVKFGWATQFLIVLEKRFFLQDPRTIEDTIHDRVPSHPDFVNHLFIGSNNNFVNIGIPKLLVLYIYRRLHC